MKIKGKKLQLGWISGMPRSGTSWLSQIFASCPEVRLKFCPLFSYEFKNILDERSSAPQWDKLFADVYHTNSEYLDQDYLRRDNLVPTFSKKNRHPDHLLIKSTRFHNLVPHILQSNQDIRFVHIVRHPCASIYSWISNSLEFPSGANSKKEWRSGECRKTGPGEFWGFDDWLQVTRQALNLSEKYPDRHRIIRYEDLVRTPQKLTQSLFNYFGLTYEKQTAKFLTQSHNRHDTHMRSVFKNPSNRDRWKKLLDPATTFAILDEVKGTSLEQFIKN